VVGAGGCKADPVDIWMYGRGAGEFSRLKVVSFSQVLWCTLKVHSASVVVVQFSNDAERGAISDSACERHTIDM
jgi:hypothetical protein